MQKRGFILACVFVFLAFNVDAATVSVSDVSSTLATVSISGAVNLYAYEINFSVDSGTTSVPTSAFYPFLANGGSTTKGSSERDNYLFVFESRLDSTKTGVIGSGSLFNVTHTGTITLKGHTLVIGNDTTEYGTYNSDGTVTITTTNTGGSSGGGGAPAGNTSEKTLSYTEDKNIKAVPDEFNLNIVQGIKVEREMSLFYEGNNAMDVELKADGDMVNSVFFEDEKITLIPDGEHKVKFWVVINERGLQTGNILLVSGSRIAKKIPIIANVRSEDFLFDVNLDILTGLSKVILGDNIVAQVGLLQVGPQLKVDVVANYEIKDLEGNSYLSESETFYVLGEKRFSKEFPTENLKPGKYVLGLEIVYPGAFAVSSSQFEVVGKRSFVFGDLASTILIAVGVIILAGVFAVIWALKKKRKKRMRKR